MAAYHDVFQHRHIGKQTDVLKGARNADAGHLMHGCGLVGMAGQGERAAVGRDQTGDDVEEGGLARAIGANQPIDLTTLDGQAHVLKRLQAAKAFGGTADLQHHIGHRCARLHSARHGLAPVACKDLPCSGAGHRPRGRSSMTLIMASAIKS